MAWRYYKSNLIIRNNAVIVSASRWALQRQYTLQQKLYPINPVIRALIYTKMAGNQIARLDTAFCHSAQILNSLLFLIFIFPTFEMDGLGPKSTID
jgi:hypothetical protein